MTHARPIVFPSRLASVTRTGPVDPPPAPVAIPEAPPPPVALGPDPQEVEAVRRVIAQLGEASRRLAAQRLEAVEELQRLALELGMAVAARLVHTHIAAGAFGVEDLVRSALAHLPTASAVTVALHPDDLALLQARLGADVATLAVDTELRILPDASLGRGDCRAQAGELTVCADLRRQLSEIRDLLLEGLPAHARPQEQTP
jgi:flagellar assembly protein FliH